MWAEVFRKYTESPGTLGYGLLTRSVLPKTLPLYERASAFMAFQLPARCNQTPRRIVFMAPYPCENLAWVLSTGVLISDFINSTCARNMNGKANLSVMRGDLLLVTNTVGASIERLRKVRLGSGSASLSLEELWLIDSFSRYQPDCRQRPSVFVANAGWVKNGIEGREIGAVILDGMHLRTWTHIPSVLERLKAVPIQIIVAPPLGERNLGELGYPQEASVWLWDPVAQQTVAKFIGENTAKCGKEVERFLWVCQDSEIDQSLGDVHELLRVSQRESFRDFPPLWSAWGIYHRLRQLAVPLSQLEDSASHVWGAVPVHKRLTRLRESWPQEVAIEARWRGIVEGLEKSYDLMRERKEPQKFWGIAERVQANLGNGGEGLRIVVPSEREVALLSMLLGYVVDEWFDALHEECIEIVSVKGEARCLARGEDRRTLLVGFRAGMLRHLDIYPCHSTEVLAYPYEVDVDESLQKYMYRFSEAIQQDSCRREFLESIGFPACEEGECPYSPRPKITVAGEVEGRVSKVRKPLVDPTYLDFQRLSSPEMSQIWDPVLLEEKVVMDELEGREGKRIEVVFEDGACVSYRDWQLVDVYHHGTGEIERCEVSKLREGMRVVSMVDGVYERLYDRVLEALHAKESPYYTAALALWEDAKSAALQKHSYSKMDLYRALQSRGLQVDYGAVVQWYQGAELENLAPQQYADMRLVAEESEKYPNDDLILMTWRVIKRERVRRRATGKALHALLRAIVLRDGYEHAIRSAREVGNEVEEMFNAVDVREVVGVREIV